MNIVFVNLTLRLWMDTPLRRENLIKTVTPQLSRTDEGQTPAA